MSSGAMGEEIDSMERGDRGWILLVGDCCFLEVTVSLLAGLDNSYRVEGPKSAELSDAGFEIGDL